MPFLTGLNVRIDRFLLKELALIELKMGLEGEVFL